MQGKARLTGVNGRAPLARALIVNYHPGLMSPGRSARRRRRGRSHLDTWLGEGICHHYFSFELLGDF